MSPKLQELLNFKSTYEVIEDIAILNKDLFSVWISDIPAGKKYFLNRVSAEDAINVLRQIEEHWYDIKHDLEMETL
jgi:hypothetical protein